MLVFEKDTLDETREKCPKMCINIKKQGFSSPEIDI